MPEEVSISENRKYITIRSYGEVSVDELKKVIREVMLIHQEYGIEKVIVESGQQDILPTFIDILEGAKYLGEMTKGKIKFAIIVRNNPSDHGLFMQAAMLHQAQISYFDNYESAMKWLEENGVKEPPPV